MDLSSPPTSFFAPWNIAWDTWEGAPDFSSEHWTAHLCNLLEYHMCHGVIEPQAEPSSLDMFNGEPVIIAPTSSQRRSFTVNGDRILARIPASDGFVYVTRNLLFPTWTTTTLQDVLISNDLTTYVSLLETVALAEYILDPNISYTLLAPTNQAFEQLGDEYLEYLQFTADGLDDLWRILCTTVYQANPTHLPCWWRKIKYSFPGKGHRCTLTRRRSKKLFVSVQMSPPLQIVRQVRHS